MNREFILLPEAEADIEDAFNWYEDEQLGVGHRFRSEVDLTLRAIKLRPQSYPDAYRGLRKAMVHRFPYSIYFLVKEDLIVVAACAHHKRHPRVWMSRRRVGRRKLTE